VKFSPEEMAYDAPADTKEPAFSIRGKAEWEQFLSFKRGFVRLDRDLRAYFKNDQQVNHVLRHVMEIMQSNSSKRRKTA
jgi:hypothetical protein